MEELRRIQPTENVHHKPRTDWQDVALWVLGGVLLLSVTVLVTLVAVGVIDVKKMAAKVRGKFSSSEPMAITAKDASQYWAVFLTNNQVYFGKLTDQDKDFVRLREVFYLRAQRQLQPAEEEGSKQQIQLIKLGSELHGPVDEIQFNRENVLFVERLKKDSRVVQGIEQYNKEGTGELPQ